MERSRAAGWAALGLGMLLGGSVGCSLSVSGGSTAAGDARPGFLDERGPIQVISAKIGAKNVFIPSTIVVSEGSGRVLSLFNTTDTPHGFRIPALGIAEILPPGEEYPIALPELRGAQVYEVNCHLHPPHRGASLVVLPARGGVRRRLRPPGSPGSAGVAPPGVRCRTPAPGPGPPRAGRG